MTVVTPANTLKFDVTDGWIKLRVLHRDELPFLTSCTTPATGFAGRQRADIG
jgi:hypothetical protein